MCGIFASIAFNEEGIKCIKQMKRRLVAGAQKRGRDGDGIYEFPNGYIGASRAQPLPEDSNIDIPLRYKFLTMAFNGTISNDKELNEQWNLNVPNEIDTHTIIQLWAGIGGQATCNELVGGYAIIVYDEHLGTLTIAKNFKTLWYSHYQGSCFLLSSEKEPLTIRDNTFSTGYPQRFPTNTMITILPDGSINEEKTTRKYWSYTPDLDNNKAIAVVSGGIDSITAAYIGKYIFKHDVTMMHFNYGQLSAIKEEEAVSCAAYNLNVPYERVDLTRLGEWGSSPLTDPSIPLPLGKQSAESTLCWTPGRNMLMLAYAAAYAEAKGAKWLYFGNNLEEEATGYSDNDLDFVHLYNQLLEYGTLKGVQIRRVLARLMKPEIIRVGNELSIDYSLTWSCDLGGDIGCGVCGCCTTRRHAFMVAGLPDEQTYENPLQDNYVGIEPKHYVIKQLIDLLE